MELRIINKKYADNTRNIIFDAEQTTTCDYCDRERISFSVLSPYGSAYSICPNCVTSFYQYLIENQISEGTGEEKVDEEDKKVPF